MRAPLLLAIPAFVVFGVTASLAENATHTISVDSADRLSTNVVGLDVYDDRKRHRQNPGHRLGRGKDA